MRTTQTNAPSRVSSRSAKVAIAATRANILRDGPTFGLVSRDREVMVARGMNFEQVKPWLKNERFIVVVVTDKMEVTA